MKVIITGSTGMVGKGVLLECLDHPAIEAVLVVNRRTVGMTHPKLREIIHNDFFNWSPIRDQLAGYDACLFCLGVTSAGKKEAEYKHMTYDLTLGLAKVLLNLTPGMTFCYVSGAGTDTTEQGRMMWARVKGKTENDLLALGFKDAYMFRPGFIEPKRGVHSSTPLYNTLITLFKPLFPLLRRFEGYSTDSVTLGKAMISASLKGADRKVLESRDINRIGRAV